MACKHTYHHYLLIGGTLSQLSDSGQTLSEDSGVDIPESGRLSKDTSPRPARTRAPRDGHGGGETSAKPVRPKKRERDGCV